MILIASLLYQRFLDLFAHLKNTIKPRSNLIISITSNWNNKIQWHFHFQQSFDGHIVTALGSCNSGGYGSKYV